MFKNRNKQPEMSKVEKDLLETEILRLKKENKDLNKQLTIANQYRDEYKTLCADYKSKSKMLEKLIKDTEELGKEKLKALEKL